MWFPTREQVIAIHAENLRRSGGAPGLLKPGALEAALERTRWGPFESYGALYERGALLLRGIILDHPFVDGNKRTGFVTTTLYLEENGRRIRGRYREFEDFVFAVARGEHDVASITAWLESHSMKV